MSLIPPRPRPLPREVLAAAARQIEESLSRLAPGLAGVEVEPAPRSGVQQSDSLAKVLGLRGTNVALFARLTATTHEGKTHFGTLAVFLPRREAAAMLEAGRGPEPAGASATASGGLLVESSHLLASAFLQALGNRYSLVFLSTSPEIADLEGEACIERFNQWLPGVCERFVVGAFDVRGPLTAGGQANEQKLPPEYADFPVSAMVFGIPTMREETRPAFIATAVIALEPLADAIGTPSHGADRARSVMVVEDSEYSRTAVVRILEKNGYRHVEEAASGDQARWILSRSSPDLVILDLMLPDEQGLDLLQWIRGRYPRANVVVLSALGQDGVARLCLDMGATAYLRKPVREADLVCELERVMSA